MTRHLQRISLFLAIVTGLPGAAGISAPQESPPNILMIFIDDLNDYIGVLGHPNAQTPNLDRLAAEGALFTNAHCQAPICGPSRASLMSGLRPSTTGIYGQIEDDDLRTASEILRYQRLLPEYLADHGYHTMGIGKLFHKHAPEGVLAESGGRVGGFGPKPPNDRYFKWRGEGTSTDWGAYPEEDADMPDTQSAAWAVERLRREYDQPFFLGVGFLRPHVPWYVPPHWFDQYAVEDLVLPPYRPDDFDDIPEIAKRIDTLPMMPTTEWAIENDEWRNIIEAYLACVSFVDAQVGAVLDALENSPHADNTMVIVLSDHGYRLGEKGTFAKHCLWAEATRVPLMIRGPGIDRGRVIREPVELLDVYPTILDLAGLPANSLNEGRSLGPLMEGESPEEERVAITTFGRNNHAVISKHFHFIRYEDGSEELYDLWKDPHGFDNVADDPVYAGAKAELAAWLPERNRLWSPASSGRWPEFMVSQRAEQLATWDFYPPEAIGYCVQQARRTLARMPGPRGMPATLPKDHDFWELKPVDGWGWTHGFWPGILWQAAEASEDPVLLDAARAYTEALKPMLDREIRSHDVGFIFNCSFGNGYRMTGDPGYRAVLIRAADRLVELFNPKVGTLLSWPAKVRNGEYAPHNTIIDSLMNLELLFRASALTGDPRYAEIAVSHADQVMRHHIRPDNSTYHLVIFDDQTGRPLAKRTHQGFADDSTWARGQAWGIYGFTMCHRETGDRAYLDAARRLADHFLERLPPDHVPFWDFDDPRIPDAPRDASAAAIAASAMLELGEMVMDPADARRYREAARALLEALSTADYRTFDRKVSFLDHSTGSLPRGREIDVPIIYADYYYLEALLRLRTP